MANQIQADVDQITAVTAAMRQFSDVLQNHHHGLLEQWGAIIHDIFTGNLQALMIDAQVAFDPKLRNIAQKIEELENRLEQFMTRLIDADSLLPTSMADLYMEIRKLYEKVKDGHSQPIKIVQTADGEYLIMLAGMEYWEDGKTNPADWLTSNNPYSAGISGLDMDSPYRADIYRAIEEYGIPSGSKVRIAGHSLGGIEAMRLANDPLMRAKYDIEDVYTFGSPDPTKVQLYDFLNPGRALFNKGLKFGANAAIDFIQGEGSTEYHRYANEGDIVPQLAAQNIPSIVNNFLSDKVSDLTGGVVALPKVGLPGQEMTTTTGTSPHSDYGYTNEKLKKTPLDFKIDPDLWTSTDKRYDADP